MPVGAVKNQRVRIVARRASSACQRMSANVNVSPGETVSKPKRGHCWPVARKLEGVHVPGSPCPPPTRKWPWRRPYSAAAARCRRNGRSAGAY